MAKQPVAGGISAKRRISQSGLTMIELIVAFTILLILSTMAVPLARYQVRRQREKSLIYDLHDMREAINRYKDMCDSGKIQAGDTDAYCYPKTLKVMVDGAPLQNTLSGNGQAGKMRFLRRVPIDPFTGDTDWGVHSMQDDPTSNTWGGQNVFDVYSKTSEKGGDGKSYSEW